MSLSTPSWLESLTWDALLDVLLPLSLFTLLLQRSSDPMGMVLLMVIWLGLKLVLRTNIAPFYWYFLGVLAICLAMLTHQISNSSPSDLLLVLLAFSVGVGRKREEWRASFWILLFIALAALFTFELDNYDRDYTRFNDNLKIIPFQYLRDLLPAEALRLQRITINRSGYILGIVGILGFTLARHSNRNWPRYFAFTLGLIAYGLAFCTGSRAAAGFPVLVLLFAELAWCFRGQLRRLATPVAIMVLMLGLMINLSMYLPSSPFSKNNPSDIGRANVAQCFFSQSSSSWSTLLTGQGGDRVSLECQRLTVPNPGRNLGPSHAHNAFLQTLADYGLPAALMLVTVVGLSLRNSLRMIAAGDALQGSMALSLGLFMLGSALVESTLITTSLQQVLSGYLLAVAWPSPIRRNEHSLQSAIVSSVVDGD